MQRTHWGPLLALTLVLTPLAAVTQASAPSSPIGPIGRAGTAEMGPLIEPNG